MDKSEKSLTEQYELRDTGVDQLIDSVDDEPAAKPPAKPAAKTNPASISPDTSSVESGVAAGPASQPAAPSKPVHPSRLVRAAEEFGLGADELALPTEELDRLVYHLARQERETLRANRRADATEASRTPNAKTSGGSPDAGPKDAAHDAPRPASGIDLGIDEKEYDPGIIKALRKIEAASVERLAKLEAAVGQIMTESRDRQRMSLTEKADRVFTARPEVFGSQLAQELDPASEFAARRVAAIQMVERMKGPGSFEQKLAKAVAVIFGDASATPEPTKQAAQAAAQPSQTWSNAALARPTQRQGAPEPKGANSAAKTAARILREAGMADTGDEMNGFLQ